MLAQLEQRALIVAVCFDPDAHNVRADSKVWDLFSVCLLPCFYKFEITSRRRRETRMGRGTKGQRERERERRGKKAEESKERS